MQFDVFVKKGRHQLVSEKLVELTRGRIVESIHRGDLAVVDASGKLLYSVGNPKEKVTFIRSASKPIQAIPVVESGAADHYQLTDQELAVFCASHNAEDIHVDTVLGILQKIGLSESALQCGSHMPLYAAAAAALQRAGKKATEVHCNCSGKHSGMLTLAQHMGWDVSNYLNLEHPVQQAMLDAMSRFSGMKKEEIEIGVDGCGVPVFGLPVYNMAWAWARLSDPRDLPPSTQQAAARIRAAMTAWPQMVAGTGRLCTDLMTRLNGRVIAKSGAQGVYCTAILDKGIGIALKIEDGNGRADGPVVVETLRQMGFLTDQDLENLKDLHQPTLYNHRRDVVGRTRAVFTLQPAQE
jgi:L-asparaginase II